MDKKEILQLFIDKYIESGYMYSGAIPINAHWFYDKDKDVDILLELVNEGKLERRKCEATSFQLPIKVRKELIEKHNLAKRWEKEAPYFYPNHPDPRIGEVTCVLSSE